MVKIENMVNKDFKYDYNNFKIDLQSLEEDESYTFISNLDLGDGLICKIVIYSNESKIPHFHIISIDNNFESCLCILDSKYYIHKNNIKPLSYNQLLNLENWLKDNSLNPHTTNWSQLCYIWDKSNWFKHYKGEDIIESIQMPEYSQTINQITDTYYEDFYFKGDK